MRSKPSEEYQLVYSTDVGSICPKCKQANAKCKCAETNRQTVLGSGDVKVRRETKGRGGKTVSTISGLAMSEITLKALLSELKRCCGSGGTIKDGVVEIQGDHCALLLEKLAEKGIKGKKAGG